MPEFERLGLLCDDHLFSLNLLPDARCLSWLVFFRCPALQDILRQAIWNDGFPCGLRHHPSRFGTWKENGLCVGLDLSVEHPLD